jgi:hypothetical protein
MNELMKPQTVADLLRDYARLFAISDELNVLFKEIDTIQERHKILIYSRYSRSTEYYKESKDTKKRMLDSAFWRALVNMAGINEILTEGAKNNMEKEFQENPPSFTAEEIETFANNIQRIYGDSTDQTIKEVYKKLINCSYHGSDVIKRDNLQGVAESFRISGGGIRWDGFFHRFKYENYAYYYSTSFDFEDLYTVCKILDKKNRRDYSDKFLVLADAQLKKGAFVDAGYFSVKPYKNGNILVTWIRKDILRLFNQIGGGQALPDSMKKRYKPEHFERAAK